MYCASGRRGDTNTSLCAWLPRTLSTSQHVLTAWRPAKGRQGPSSTHTHDRGEESGQNAFKRTCAGPRATPYGRWSSLTLSSLPRVSDVVFLTRHVPNFSVVFHQVSIPSLHHRKISEAPLRFDGSVRITNLGRKGTPRQQPHLPNSRTICNARKNDNANGEEHHEEHRPTYEAVFWKDDVVFGICTLRFCEDHQRYPCTAGVTCHNNPYLQIWLDPDQCGWLRSSEYCQHRGQDREHRSWNDCKIGTCKLDRTVCVRPIGCLMKRRMSLEVNVRANG